ncbi:MAG: YidC/Oxa1 family membrane protein insertase [Oscillospiraceae bacterium]|nr:YidC/Oxa1 family membrane protein insertase [Oscillospiraceae bacterium]
MTFGSALYQLLIGPLQLLFEVIFVIAHRVTENPGLSIVFLSLAMNFLVLPLYRQADAMQAEARDREAVLQHWIRHIRRTFHGDERVMLLQTYYRQNNYSPLQSLSGSLSLLLEIPFFIAAYRFLSGLEVLNGASFGPIANLGAPDALITVGSVHINLLPLLMTGINLISAAVYMKGFPLKNKIQMVGIAFIFLILLYPSPSGLVFYWTLNNVFSLAKNILYKVKNPRKILAVGASLLGIALLIYVLLHPLYTSTRQIFCYVAALALQIPLILSFRPGRRKAFSLTLPDPDKRLFELSCVFLTLLTGLLIPSSVIHASPLEFVNTYDFSSPLRFILPSVLLAAGLFLIWFNVFYFLSDARGKTFFGLLACAMALGAAVDYMFFGTEYGNLSSALVYDTVPSPSLALKAVNIAILLAIFVLVILLRRKAGFLRVLSLALCISAAVMAAVNISGIQKTYSAAKKSYNAYAEEDPVIPLSRNGKNVIVMMLDRAISGYFPFLLEEKPELQRQFAGFTWYPNTISFGPNTIFANAALYGGYDYTPEQINGRPSLSLVEKQNEALKVMPVLFDENSFSVTVCDPTYANYSWIPDLTIYADYPDIRCYNTMTHYHSYDNGDKTLFRNFFCYSFFRASPLLCQPILYHFGDYNAAPMKGGEFSYAFTPVDVSVSIGIREHFLPSYEVLERLPEISEIGDSSSNTFLMMSNDTSHEPVLLQKPDYTPANYVNNSDYDSHYKSYDEAGHIVQLLDIDNSIHYNCNMAAMLQLGKWFDWLRENQVYDNTRIILVADHGWDLESFYDVVTGEEQWEYVGLFNPLLLVKDFDSQELRTDTAYMTNADVPELAMKGLIEDPVNPYTGNRMDSAEQKELYGHLVFYSDRWEIADNIGNNTFTDGEWYSVKDTVFDPAGWTAAEEPGSGSRG